MTLATITEAAAWLRDHADELREPPPRLHDAAIGESGAPRYSAAFWSLLVTGPYATRDITEKRNCSIAHGFGDPCERCGGAQTYDVERRFYKWPLHAALASLKKAPATSPQWPTPHQLVIAFMRSGYDLATAAEIIGRPIRSEDERKVVEAAFILACRKLVGRYASGPVLKAGRSESQSIAEFEAA